MKEILNNLLNFYFIRFGFKKKSKYRLLCLFKFIQGDMFFDNLLKIINLCSIIVFCCNIDYFIIVFKEFEFIEIF